MQKLRKKPDETKAWLGKVAWLATWIYVLDSELIKLLGFLTCECATSGGQPFNQWFYPAFQSLPYTSWFHYHGYSWLSGPYSLIWWGLNSPAYFGYWTFNSYLWTVDLVLTVFLVKKGRRFGLVYATLSPWFTLIDPVDWFIIALLFLGRYYWPLLILGPLTKLPIGAPLWVWQWVLSNPNSLNGAENWGRYSVLITLWMISLVAFAFDRRKAQKLFDSRNVRSKD